MIVGSPSAIVLEINTPIVLLTRFACDLSRMSRFLDFTSGSVMWTLHAIERFWRLYGVNEQYQSLDV